MQVLGQGLEDANILKVLQCFFFSNLKTLDLKIKKLFKI